MKKHFVYFYGSTKIVSGHNSLRKEGIRKRNQVVGFEGIDVNPELVEYGEVYFVKRNHDGSLGETGTIYPKNITIVPFRYLYKEELIVRHLEDVITANQQYIKADSVGFPLMMLKSATKEGYNWLGEDASSFTQKQEIEFKKNFCCYGHYYLHLLKKALKNKGYSAIGVSADEKKGNLINKVFGKVDGTRLEIHADAGL